MKKAGEMTESEIDQELASLQENDIDQELKSLGYKDPTDYAEAGKAFGASALNEAVLGYGPQIVGGVQSLLSPEEGDYAAKRDAVIKDLEAFKTNYPKASIAGQVTGAVGSGLATGGLLPQVRLAGLAGRALQSKGVAQLGLRALRSGIQAGLGGAAVGAAYNPGDVEGQVAPLQIADRAQGAATGLLTGGVLGGAGQAAGSVLRGAGSKLSETAGNTALRVFKPGKKAVMDLGPQGVKDVGSLIIKKKLLAADPEELVQMVTQSKQQSGKILGDAYEQLFQESPKVLDKAQIAKEVIEEIAPQKGVPGSQSALKKMQALVKEFTDDGGSSLNLRDLQKVKEKVGKSAGFNKNTALKDLTPSEEVNRALYGKLSSFQDDAAEEIVGVIKGPAAKQALQQQKQEYAMLKKLQKLAEEKFAASKANRAISLTDVITGSTGLGVGFVTGDGDVSERALGALAMGAALGGGNKLFRKYGAPVSLSAINKLAKTIEDFGGRVDKLSPKQKALYGDLVQRGRLILQSGE